MLRLRPRFCKPIHVRSRGAASAPVRSKRGRGDTAFPAANDLKAIQSIGRRANSPRNFFRSRDRATSDLPDRNRDGKTL
jgi:hypothetical protein